MVNTWKPILAALVIFAAGVVTGALTLRVAVPRPPMRPPPPGLGEARQNTDLLNRMERELLLAPDQRQRIGDVLRESQEKTRQLWDSIAPQVQAERKRMHERIRGLLTTDEQRRKYDESFKMRGPGRGDFRFRSSEWEERRGPRTNRENGPGRMGQPNNSPAREDRSGQ